MTTNKQAGAAAAEPPPLLPLSLPHASVEDREKEKDKEILQLTLTATATATATATGSAALSARINDSVNVNDNMNMNVHGLLVNESGLSSPRHDRDNEDNEEEEDDDDEFAIDDDDRSSCTGGRSFLGSVVSVTSMDRQGFPFHENFPDDDDEDELASAYHFERLSELAASRIEDDVGLKVPSGKRILHDSLRAHMDDPVDFQYPGPNSYFSESDMLDVEQQTMLFDTLGRMEFPNPSEIDAMNTPVRIKPGNSLTKCSRQDNNTMGRNHQSLHGSDSLLKMSLNEDSMYEPIGERPQKTIFHYGRKQNNSSDERSRGSRLLRFMSWKWFRRWSYGVDLGIAADDTESNKDLSGYFNSRSTTGSASIRSVVVKTSYRVNSSKRKTGTTVTSIPESHSVKSGSAAAEEESSSTSENQLNTGVDIVNKTLSSAKRSTSSLNSATNNKLKELDVISSKDYVYLAGMFDVWAYVMTTVIGGIYYGWNEGLTAGFGSYATAQVLVGFSFLTLGFSLAEIMSTVSFSGGAYGMARVVLGFYFGFIIAVFELLEYLTYTAVSAQYIGDFLCSKLLVDEAYAPLFCLCFYIVAGSFVLEGNVRFWNFSRGLAVVSVLIIVIYCFGSLGRVNFAENASLHRNTSYSSGSSNWFAGGMFAFMRILPFTTWGFGGLESAALIGDMTENPRINLSYGLAIGSITLFICTIFVLFVAVSLPPGLSTFVKDPLFMNVGFETMGINNTTAEWLVLPAQFAMAFGFILPASKLLRSMSTSNLLPPILGIANSETRRASVIYVLIGSYLFCLIAIYVPEIDFENIPILLAQFTYLSDLYAFYKLRTDFSNRENKFRSPFGIVGAVCASVMFTLIGISVLGFQGTYDSGLYLSVLVVFLSFYYFGYAEKKQHFSDDEQKCLLVLHVIRNNKKKKKMKSGNNTNKAENFIQRWWRLNVSS